MVRLRLRTRLKNTQGIAVDLSAQLYADDATTEPAFADDAKTQPALTKD